MAGVKRADLSTSASVKQTSLTISHQPQRNKSLRPVAGIRTTLSLVHGESPQTFCTGKGGSTCSALRAASVVCGNELCIPVYRSNRSTPRLVVSTSTSVLSLPMRCKLRLNACSNLPAGGISTTKSLFVCAPFTTAIVSRPYQANTILNITHASTLSRRPATKPKTPLKRVCNKQVFNRRSAGIWFE